MEEFMENFKPVVIDKIVPKLLEKRDVVESLYRAHHDLDSSYKVSVEELKEFKNQLMEDLNTGDNTALYTTVMAGIVDQAIKKKLVALNYIKTLDYRRVKGASAIKIPKNDIPTVVELTEGAAIPDTSYDYSSTEIGIKWVGGRIQITQQLIRISSIDVIKDQLNMLGYGLAKKIDSDIYTELINASPSDDSNNNYVKTGDNGTGVPNPFNYNVIVDAIEKAENNGITPEVLLVNPTQWAELMRDPDIKDSLAFTAGNTTEIFARIQEIFGVKLISTPTVPAGNGFLIDPTYLGYYVDWSDTLVRDREIPNTIDYEVVAAKAYGIGISRPEAYVRIEKAL